MKGSAVVGLVVALILVAAGAGFLVGSSSSTTRVSTTTVTNSGLETTFVAGQTVTMTSTTTTTLQTTILGPNAGKLGSWNKTSSYPLYVGGTSCVAESSFAYCVGGYNGTDPFLGEPRLNMTYFAVLSSSGISKWTRTTDYPTGIQDETCVTALGYIYCVGGSSTNSTDPYNRTAAVYYAPLSSSGIGAWSSTTSFPYPAPNPRCVAYGSDLFCVEPDLNGSVYTGTPEAYFAPLSATGLGPWVHTTAPPNVTAGCSTTGGYIYCFGGGACLPMSDCPSPSYYAPLSANGIGPWSSTSPIPTSAYAVYAGGDYSLYYFARSTYFALSTSSGLTSWDSTTTYPEVFPASCFSSGFYLYCIGGVNSQSGSGQYTNSSYFVLIDS
jgi:hypothetical protein